MGTVVIGPGNGLHENWEGSRARRDMGEATARSEDGDAPLAGCVASSGGVGGNRKELAPLLVRRSWRSTSWQSPSVKTRR